MYAKTCLVTLLPWIWKPSFGSSFSILYHWFSIPSSQEAGPYTWRSPERDCIYFMQVTTFIMQNWCIYTIRRCAPCRMDIDKDGFQYYTDRSHPVIMCRESRLSCIPLPNSATLWCRTLWCYYYWDVAFFSLGMLDEPTVVVGNDRDRFWVVSGLTWPRNWHAQKWFLMGSHEGVELQRTLWLSGCVPVCIPPCTPNEEPSGSWVLWAVLWGMSSQRLKISPTGRSGRVYVEHQSSSTASWALSWRSRFPVFWHYWWLLSELPQCRVSRPAASTADGWKKLRCFSKWRGRLRWWL